MYLQRDRHLLHGGGEAGHRPRVGQQPRHSAGVRCQAQRFAARGIKLLDQLRHLQSSGTLIWTIAHTEHMLSRLSTEVINVSKGEQIDVQNVTLGITIRECMPHCSCHLGLCSCSHCYFAGRRAAKLFHLLQSRSACAIETVSIAANTDTESTWEVCCFSTSPTVTPCLAPTTMKALRHTTHR